MTKKTQSVANDIVSTIVRVEKLGGHLVLFVPFSEGGKLLASVTRGIGDFDGDRLKIVLPGWLAEQYAIKAGSRVAIDNRGGTFNLFPVPDSDLPKSPKKTAKRR